MFVFSDPAKLRLRLYHHSDVQHALKSLEQAGGVYTELLSVQRVDPGVRQVVEPSHIQVPTYDSGNKVEGKLPEDYEHQAAYSSFANEVFGLQSQRHLNRLVDYLRMSGPFELELACLHP